MGVGTAGEVVPGAGAGAVGERRGLGSGRHGGRRQQRGETAQAHTGQAPAQPLARAVSAVRPAGT